MKANHQKPVWSHQSRKPNPGKCVEKLCKCIFIEAIKITWKKISLRWLHLIKGHNLSSNIHASYNSVYMPQCSRLSHLREQMFSVWPSVVVLSWPCLNKIFHTETFQLLSALFALSESVCLVHTRNWLDNNLHQVYVWCEFCVSKYLNVWNNNQIVFKGSATAVALMLFFFYFKMLLFADKFSFANEGAV